MRIDVSEGGAGAGWAPLPTDDRVFVGGRTVWTGPHRIPVVVAQPNRWGVIEASFPPAPCLVESDPLVTGHLPLPEQVVGYVDRSHRSIPEPQATPLGSTLMQAARRLGGMLTQISGVRLLASPFGRTVPLLTPMGGAEVASGLSERGVVGARALAEIGGGVVVSVRPEHGEAELARIVEALASVIER